MEIESLEEQFIVLNFKEKVEQSFFDKPNLFFKVVNLDTKHPLIQIGDHVFSGTYDPSMVGTSLLFKESEETNVSETCEEASPINLEFCGKSMKVLSMRWQKVPEEIANVDPQDLIRLKFTEDYATVLHKIEEQTLDINNIVESKGNAVSVEINEDKKVEVEDEENQMETVEKRTEKSVPFNQYNFLRHAVTPQTKLPEYYQQVNDEMKREKDYFILKELFLKSLDYKNIIINVDKENISDYVDIPASIRNGIIENKKMYDLTDMDKQNLINLKNFDNLSIPMKLAILVEHLQEEKKLLAKMSKEELSAIDEFNRTPKHRYRLLKSLAKDLQYHIFERMCSNRLEAKDPGS